jgi:hypothetical protein
VTALLNWCLAGLCSLDGFLSYFDLIFGLCSLYDLCGIEIHLGLQEMCKHGCGSFCDLNDLNKMALLFQFVTPKA